MERSAMAIRKMSNHERTGTTYKQAKAAFKNGKK